jgi:hypothetical protein
MTADTLVGAWRLISYNVRDDEGAIVYPFGWDDECDSAGD